MEDHYFIDPDTPHTLQILPDGVLGFGGIIKIVGDIYCLRGVALAVDKRLQTRYFGRTLEVRTYHYRYAAYLRGRHNLLRYHNTHQSDNDYHRVEFNPLTGALVRRSTMPRRQFPVLSEVLDELETMTRMLES